MPTAETEGRPIVRTDSVLGGDPRIKGTRIGVRHVVYPILEGEYSIEHMTSVTYPELSQGDILSALAYYIEHREEIEEIRERNRRVHEDEITSPGDLPPELQTE
jgi:uncharacterized protein (DUF433 family)